MSIREGQTWRLHRQDDPSSKCDGRLRADGPCSNTKQLVVCDLCGHVYAIPSSSEPAEFEQERMPA